MYKPTTLAMGNSSSNIPTDPVIYPQPVHPQYLPTDVTPSPMSTEVTPGPSTSPRACYRDPQGTVPLHPVIKLEEQDPTTVCGHLRQSQHPEITAPTPDQTNMNSDNHPAPVCTREKVGHTGLPMHYV